VFLPKIRQDCTPKQLENDATARWIGIWRNMGGYMGGASPDLTMAEIKDPLRP
jgi:hypothetical protein